MLFMLFLLLSLSLPLFVLHKHQQAQGRAKLGVEAFAEALLGFVKILAENSG